MLRDVFLAAGEVVSEQQVEHLARCGGFIRRDADEAARFRVHGGLPHHVRLVLAQTLGALDEDLLALELFEDSRLFGLVEGKIALVAIGDLVERRLRDIDIALLDERRDEAVDHGQDQRADLEAVHVGIGADDDAVPAQAVEVERRQILRRLAAHLDAAAEDLEQVGNDVVLEDLVVIRLQAVQDLAAHGHDRLKFAVAALLDRAERGVALHDVQLAARNVLRAAVDELLHAVCQIDVAGQLLFDVEARLFRLLAAALVDQDLLGDLVRLGLVLDEVDLESLLEELGHRLLNEPVRDGLLGLVLIGGLGRKAVGHEHKAVENILIRYLALVLVVLVVLLEVGVDGGDERRAHRLVRRAAVLEPRRVVVVFDARDRRGEAERAGQLDLVFRLVRAVAAAPLAFKELHRRQRRFACQLADIVHDAVLVQKFGGVEFAAAHLIFQHEFDVAVDDCLTLERIEVVIHRDVDVGENLKVGLPSDRRAGLSGVRRLFREAFLCAGPVFALFEVQAVLEPVAHDGDVHVFRGILRRAGTETVQAERELIVFAGVVLVLAACVQLAEHELPVIALFLFVPFDRDAAAVVGDFDRAVRIADSRDVGAVALARLVDGVGEDFEHCVLAALQTVRAENDARALAHAVRALQRGYTVVAVRRLCFTHIL